MRDIPGHILGLFLFFVVFYYAYAFGFSRDAAGNISVDLNKNSGPAFLFMMVLIWLPALVFTLFYYLLFRANLAATLMLGAVAAALLFLAENRNLDRAFFLGAGCAAAFAYHAAIITMRLFVGDRRET